ncbi:hypothetical protein ACFSBS_23355 [Azospirillum griseum]
MIRAAVHRIRSYFQTVGMSRHQIAKAAELNWRAVDEVLSPDGNPKLKTLMKIDLLVPPDFVPPTNREAGE